MYFWAIPNGRDRVGAFLSWLEGLPVDMVNRLTPPVLSPGDAQARVDVEQRVAAWVNAAIERQAERAHLDLRIAVGGWSPAATDAVREAAMVLLALDPHERDHPGAHLVLAPFDALGPIGAALD